MGVNVRGKVEELDPFVKEILSSDSVPKAVKTKIREECWSLFNDPRTPKGVKQCILNTICRKHKLTKSNKHNIAERRRVVMKIQNSLQRKKETPYLLLHNINTDNQPRKKHKQTRKTHP